MFQTKGGASSSASRSDPRPAYWRAYRLGVLAERYSARRALHALTPTTPDEASALVAYYAERAELSDDPEAAEDYQPGYGIAQARENDLSRCLGVERIERLPLALPSGRLVGPVLDLVPVAASTADPYPAATSTRVQFGRALNRAGEVLAALVIVVGGCGFVGFATLF